MRRSPPPSRGVTRPVPRGAGISDSRTDPAPSDDPSILNLSVGSVDTICTGRFLNGYGSLTSLIELPHVRGVDVPGVFAPVFAPVPAFEFEFEFVAVVAGCTYSPDNKSPGPERSGGARCILSCSSLLNGYRPLVDTDAGTDSDMLS